MADAPHESERTKTAHPFLYWRLSESLRIIARLVFLLLCSRGSDASAAEH
jgi:hypothetical protein